MRRPAYDGALSLLPDVATTIARAGASCGGAWVGPEAAVHVMRGLGEARETELAPATRALAARASLPWHDDLATRACPTCAVEMRSLDVGGIHVDSCAAHGTWFDRDEVARVVLACTELRDVRIQSALGTTRTTGARWSRRSSRSSTCAPGASDSERPSRRLAPASPAGFFEDLTRGVQR